MSSTSRPSKSQNAVGDLHSQDETTPLAPTIQQQPVGNIPSAPMRDRNAGIGRHFGNGNAPVQQLPPPWRPIRHHVDPRFYQPRFPYQQNHGRYRPQQIVVNNYRFINYNIVNYIDTPAPIVEKKVLLELVEEDGDDRLIVKAKQTDMFVKVKQFVAARKQVDPKKISLIHNEIILQNHETPKDYRMGEFAEIVVVVEM